MKHRRTRSGVDAIAFEKKVFIALYIMLTLPIILLSSVVIKQLVFEP